MHTPLNLKDYEPLARAKLPRGIYDYYARGAADDITLHENETAWTQLRLSPRVLVDVSACDLRTTILGRQVAMPIMAAPCAYNAMAHPDGELAVGRAAAALNIIQVVSSGSTYDLEKIATVNPNTRWFQLYCLRDPGVTRALAERAEAAGYAALCLTVDAPCDGLREHNIRNKFDGPPPGLRQANLDPYFTEPFDVLPDKFRHDSTITWETVKQLRASTRLPLVLKGILSPEDARLAIAHGANGIVVSNHGGRQLDTAISSCQALRGIADAVAGQTELFVDGGVRRGTDVLKALALGARAVLIGRPYLWGLTVDGEAGVRRIFEILSAELRLSMQLVGCRHVGEVGKALLS